MPIRLLSATPFIFNLRTRIPFRYGIVTVTEMPHVFVRIEVDIEGRREVGLAADHLAPKWFTKNPNTSPQEDTTELLEVVEAACTIAKAVPPMPTVYAFWKYLYQTQGAWGGGWGKPPLLSHFGTSLIERAMIDAFCKARSVPFWKAVRHNTLGVDLGMMHAELVGSEPKDWLPPEPLRQIIARHTVGLIDPLTEAAISSSDRLTDGLPQSLEACIAAYGLTHFKIKLSGDVENDVDRIRQIAALLKRSVADGAYHFSFDANEHFMAVGAFQDYWNRLSAETSLAKFMDRLMFVEQPLHRDVALSANVTSAFTAWSDHPPMIIDESDGQVESAYRALEAGYIGTSHKNCKGVFKGLANACLIASRRKADPAGRYHMSGEDLANVGPVALLQDLAVVSALGISDVERNGHHYFRGLSDLPTDVQATVAHSHPDLFHMKPEGFAAVKIENGKMQIGSLVDAPFGTGFDLDPSTI